ncbi:hypothetical protein ILFOPFJJ_06331 [Ensifer psoraleae]|nr:hypothetical protein [Sinorhizobium psoraleae]
MLSAPAPPFSTLAPALPVRTLFPVLPVPLMFPLPSSARFSTVPSTRAVLARLKLIRDCTVSVPEEPVRLSLTMSLALSTT